MSTEIETQTTETAPVDTQPTDSAPADQAQDPNFVPFASVAPPANESRRERAAREMREALDARLKEFETKSQQQLSAYEQRMERLQQENARLAGNLEAMQKAPQYTPPPAPKPARPDPAELRKQARKALDEKEFDRYEELRDQAARIEYENHFDERAKQLREEIKQQIPPQIPPHINTLLVSHKNVATNPKGLEWVLHMEKQLELYGHQPSYERTQKAFELADKALKPKPANQGFDQGAAGALASVATARGGASPAGGNANGYKITDAEDAARVRMGMTKEEWVKYKHPQKYGLL